MKIHDSLSPSVASRYLSRDEKFLITATIGRETVTFIGLARDLMSSEFKVIAATRAKP